MLVKNEFGVWQIDLTVDGKRIRKSTRTKDKKLAEKLHTLTESEALLGKHGIGKKQKFTLKEAFRMALESHFSKKKYCFKVEQNWSLLTRGKDAVLDESLDVSEVSPEIIREMKLKLSSLGNSPATINRKMAVVRKLLNLCHEWGKVEHIPKIDIETEEGERHRVLTVEEEVCMIRFFAETYPEQAGLYEFLLSSGNRLSEVLKLTWFDVDFKNGSVRFPNTKSGKTLWKPMTETMRRVLESSMGRIRPFPFTIHQCQNSWKYFRKHMGEDYVNDPAFVTHSLRHTCGSRLVAAGVDLLRVQMWLGHESYETTRGYAKLETKHLEDVVSTINSSKKFDYSLSTLSQMAVGSN